MKTRTRLIAFGVAAMALAGTANAEQDTIKKSFPARDGGKLFMKVDRGSIHIIPSASDKVDITVVRELKSVSAAKAKEIFAQHKVDMSATEGEVRIEAD